MMKLTGCIPKPELIASGRTFRSDAIALCGTIGYAKIMKFRRTRRVSLLSVKITLFQGKDGWHCLSEGSPVRESKINE